MIVSTKIAKMFKDCGFVNIDYLLQNKIESNPSKILNILNRDWRKWVKPVCVKPNLKSLDPNDPNFGYETKGGTELAPAGNYINGSWYSCPGTGDADSITVYLKQKFENLPKIKCPIYKKSDGALVGYTEEWTLTSGWDGWKTFNIISGGSLTAQDYWLVFWTNNLVSGYEDAETNKGLYKSQTYDGFPDPLTGFTLIARKWSVYCTYTTGGPPPSLDTILVQVI